MSLRILYIGKFDHSHSTERYVTNAFRDLGHTVKGIPAKTRISNAGIQKRVEEFEPSFILFSKAKPSYINFLLDYCRKKEILTVCWQWDLYFSLRGKSAMPPQFYSDYLFTTDGGHQEEFKKHKYNHHLLRQGIHKPEAKIVTSKNFTFDLAFVGSYRGHKSRMKLIKWLKKEYPHQFEHHTHTRGMKLNRALGRVKIVVGDSYPSPNYWSNRVYEILGRGGFLLHPKTEGLDMEFEDGKDYISYPRGDHKQLQEIIAHYIQQDTERETIRLQGHSKCLKQYTYHQRVLSLLSTIRLG